jgi:phosphatidylglycerophosphatase C
MSQENSWAAFDFDGTITVRDSFNAFLRWRAGAANYRAGQLRLAPAAQRWAFDRDLTRLKAAMVEVYLKGAERLALEAACEAFAGIAAPRLFRPDALLTWRGLKGQGVKLAIVTASPEPVVAPFARRLGADLLIGTRLVYDAQDRVAGPLEGPNCRGAEKVRRLRAAIGPDARLIAAYGDTEGDRELLAEADEGFMKVFTGRP